MQQKTGNFKVAIVSRVMQWGPSTEEKKKNEIAQTEFGLNNAWNNCQRALTAIHFGGRRRKHLPSRDPELEQGRHFALHQKCLVCLQCGRRQLPQPAVKRVTLVFQRGGKMLCNHHQEHTFFWSSCAFLAAAASASRFRLAS
jgi:hypothetical protein